MTRRSPASAYGIVTVTTLVGALAPQALVAVTLMLYVPGTTVPLSGDRLGFQFLQLGESPNRLWPAEAANSSQFVTLPTPQFLRISCRYRRRVMPL